METKMRADDWVIIVIGIIFVIILGIMLIYVAIEKPFYIKILEYTEKSSYKCESDVIMPFSYGDVLEITNKDRKIIDKVIITSEHDGSLTYKYCYYER